MVSRAACNELSWPSRHLRLVTTCADLGTAGKMRSASEPSTTRLRPKKEQFSTAIRSAVFLPNGASAFGYGNACELPAARIIGMIFSDLRIQGCGRINERGSKLQRLRLRSLHVVSFRRRASRESISDYPIYRDLGREWLIKFVELFVGHRAHGSVRMFVEAIQGDVFPRN